MESANDTQLSEATKIARVLSQQVSGGYPPRVARGRRLAASIVGAITLIIAMLEGVGRLLLPTQPEAARYLPFVYVAGFGLAMWLLDTARRSEVGELRRWRASLRAAYQPQTSETPIRLTNIGELEAQHAQIEPVKLDGYPWLGRFREIGSISSGGESSPELLIERREILGDCIDCLTHGKPRGFGELIANFGRHRRHVLQEKHAATSEPPAEEVQWLDAFSMLDKGATAELSLPLLMTWTDPRKNRYRGRHRVDVRLQRGDWEVWCEFEREDMSS